MRWATVKIPKSLAEAVDAYLLTEDAALTGYKSRSDLITKLVADWVKQTRLNATKRLTATD
ncbi:MAG: ribbon-helix-helix domain-containing protein [Candidatus Caldarchaeum sp.]